jgi:uncharacterized membrane protein YbhN (UPF0104 family)
MLERDGIDTLGERLGALDARWLVAAVSLHFLAVLAGVLRWRLLLRASGVDLSLPWLLRSFLIGRFVGAFTPSTTGLDGWRLWDAGKASGSMGRSAAAIAVEKLVGLIGMAVVCAALVPSGGAALLGSSAIGLALALAGGAAVGLALLGRPAMLASVARRMPRPIRGRAEKVVDALGTLELDGGRVGGAVALGVVSHAALSAVFWATSGALQLPVDGWTLLAVGNAIVLAVLLPVSIGGVGVREGVAVVLLASVGIGSTDAMLVALLGYLTGQAPALVGGVLLAAQRSAERSEPSLAAEQTLS